VSVLSKEIDPSELAAKNINVAIIGCGDWSLIKSYVADTESKYPIYADPSQKLYKLFGLIRTLALGKKPAYISFTLWGGVKKAISDGFKVGITNAFKGGDVKQVGGEYQGPLNPVDSRFLIGPGNKCTWGNRMKTTRDHTEMVDLRKVLNLQTKETDGTHTAEAPVETAEPIAS